MIVCPSCGQENPAGFRLCGMCGVPLAGEAAPAREERKVVTVLCAEFVGVASQVARRDPEDVRALLSPHHERLRSLIERYGGTIDSLVGATAVALFGVPAAHEDDAERAVLAALKLRELAHDDRLELRMGIDTGEALVTLAAQAPAGARAAGDVVNRATSLLAAAAVDEIVVGIWTFERTQHAIDYRDSVPVQERGTGRALRVWKAIGTRARLGVDVAHHARAPLIGRERDLDVLRHALVRMRRNRAPELVTLVGAPGIGKSRLVFELMNLVEADEELISWRQGRSLPYGDGVTYWALGEMVKAQAGIQETDEAEDAEEKLHRAVSEALPDAEVGWVLGHLRPLAGLGGETDPRGDRRADAFAAWRRFFEALAEQRPLVLVFEDLQWADEGLLEFVDNLVKWTTGVPLLVVGTARPELLERRTAWGGGKRNAATVSLEPLSEDETAALIGELLGTPVLSAETQSALVARAGGNPLYAEQYARMLEEQGGGDDLALPATVQGIITARLDGLPLAQKTLLQDAAVIGKVFWAGAVASTAGIDRRRAEQLLEELERKELVQRARRSSIAGEVEYAFRHLPVQDVAYGQIPRAQRAEKHRLAARWFHSLGRPEGYAELLAHHYVSALELGRATGADVRALVGPARNALRDAGDRAMALNAFRAAAGSYTQALELWPPDDPALPQLLFRLGRALQGAGDEAAADMLERAHLALTTAGERETAAEADALLAEAWWLRGQRDRAFAHLSRARQLVRDSGPSAAKARVLAAFSRNQALAGEDQTARVLGAEALAMAEALGLQELQAHALNTIGLAKSLAGDRSWIEDLERSVEIATAANSREAVRAVNNLASLLSSEGDLRRALPLWHEARGLAERFGDRQMVRFIDGTLIWALFLTGDWNGSVHAAYDFIAECEAGSPHYQESSVRATRGLVRHIRGDGAGALEDTERGIELGREVKDPQVLLPALGARARVCVELGRLDEARALADEVIAAGRVTSAARQATMGELIWVADKLGRRHEVRELIAPIAHGSRWTDAVLAVLGRDFERAAALYGEIGAVPYEADARLRLAEQLIAEGRRGAGEAELRQALEFYRAVGATRYIAESESLLATQNLAEGRASA